MSSSLDHLLPAPEASVRCAEFARTIGVDPGGTAIRADRVVLVEVPLPWPKPALSHPRLQPLAELFGSAATAPIRLLATVPYSAAGDEVVVFERNGASASERRYRPSSDADLLDLGHSIASGDLDAGPTATEHLEVAAPAVLVCTQGSHDVCCGSEGMRFADDIGKGALDSPGPAVFRVSHTGGHRFAPTAMTLPDGRMWAGLNEELLGHILTGAPNTGNPPGDNTAGYGLEALVGSCRGWWGAETGPAQIAERAVFAERGWALNGLDRWVEPVSVDGASTTVRVSVRGTDGRVEGWEVVVVEGREVPTIACREPGGLPAKRAREYTVGSISRT